MMLYRKILGLALVWVSLTSLTASAASSREGTTVRLSPSEIADLKQWVENAKQDLELLQDDIRRLSLEKRRWEIVREFEAIVSRSARKENELLMRYTLNRAVEISELVGKSPAPSELQSLVAFLDSTIELSKGFYTDDQKYLEAIGRGDAPQLQTPMALFAYQYAEMILQFSRTFLRPALEYQITYKALGWLANDLNSPRNLLRIQFSEGITRIARLQAKFPEQPEGDDPSILQSIRQFKWEYRERVLKHIASVNGEIRDALERAEQRRQEEARIARLSIEQRQREIREREEHEAREKKMGELRARGISFVAEDVFTVNKLVIYGNSKSKITGIYRNGMFSLIQTDYPYTVTASVSAAQIAAIEDRFCSIQDFRFCVGTTAQYRNTTVTVVGIFLDGTLALRMPDYPYSTYSPVEPKDLAISKKGVCSKDDPRYCFETKVRYNGAAYTIRGVYANGKLVVRQNDYPYSIQDALTVDQLALE